MLLHVADIWCLEMGHMSKGCPADKVESTDQPTITCPNCSAVGHRLRDCPEERQVRERKPMDCRRCGESECLDQSPVYRVATDTASQLAIWRKTAPTRMTAPPVHATIVVSLCYPSSRHCSDF